MLGWKFWAFISGGAALPGAVESFWNRLGYAVIQGYGMTETTALISLNHPFRLGKGSIGKLFPGLEMKVSAEGEILVRGENVAAGYWRNKELQPVVEGDGWFHTGDLAQVDETGQLYFKGRQKNVIVTPAGMNIYPEDLERALREQPGVKDCVVLGIERDGNAEPCAVLLLDDPAKDPAPLVAAANQSLADFQRMRRWFVWPEPDFPRTPTQKPVLQRIRATVEGNLRRKSHATRRKLSGEPDRPNHRPATRLRVSAVRARPAIEHEFARPRRTDGRARRTLSSGFERRKIFRRHHPRPGGRTDPQPSQGLCRNQISALASELVRHRHPYRRLLFDGWPATYLLAAPRIRGRENLRGLTGPVLVVSNHVTYVDIGWILAALPARFRHRLATAMRSERIATMLQPPAEMGFLERCSERWSYFLVFALFNVFPLPRESGFRRSFAFAGDLADRGWNSLIFPEGLTTPDGELHPFRVGIGLLAKQLGLPVIPIRLDGLYDMKKENRIAHLPGKVRVTIGAPVRFPPSMDPKEIALDLERRVAGLHWYASGQ